jgi:hypothetical protein
VPKSVHP